MGVYKIYENGWKRALNSKRAYFDGEEAPIEIKNIFINKKYQSVLEEDKILQVIVINRMCYTY